MHLSALRALFQTAHASSPGQSSTDEKSAIGQSLIKSTFLGAIDTAVAGQLRLLFPDADIQDLPRHAKENQDESVGLHNRNTGVCQVADRSVEPDQIAALRSEVQTRTEAVNAIHFADTGQGWAAAAGTLRQTRAEASLGRPRR